MIKRRVHLENARPAKPRSRGAEERKSGRMIVAPPNKTSVTTRACTFSGCVWVSRKARAKHVCVCGYVHMKVWVAHNVQLTEIYIFQYDDVPRNFVEHFATVINVGVWCGLCCMLVEKKFAQGKCDPIKSRTIHPKYTKILNSPSSTFFTMTASLESF